jgi:signal transduction histidine kinase
MAEWQTAETQAIWLAVGLAFILVLIGFFIMFTRIYLRKRMSDTQKMANMQVDHQKKLLNDSIRVQEIERERIAADLHDELISKLNIVMLLTYSSNNNNKNKDAADLLKYCIDAARRISHDLSPPLINENRFLEFVEDMISHYRNAFNINYYVSEHVEIDVESNMKLQLIRIMQEVLNNTLKHAEANTINFMVRITSNLMGIIIRDDGVGFDTKNNKSGLGLSNIEMRTQMLNGRYKLRSQINKGTSYFFLFLPQTINHK